MAGLDIVTTWTVVANATAGRPPRSPEGAATRRQSRGCQVALNMVAVHEFSPIEL